jgi:hypothetical protein
LWLAGAAAALIAALVAYLVLRGAGLTPIAESQVPRMSLDGRWTGADGVTIMFSNPRFILDDPGGDFAFADLSNSPDWATKSHLDGTGEWWFGHLPKPAAEGHSSGTGACLPDADLPRPLRPVQAVTKGLRAGARFHGFSGSAAGHSPNGCCRTRPAARC